MKAIYTFIRSREWLVVTIAAVAGVLSVTAVVNAATVISTDITTAGNVYATSTIQATGNIIGYSNVGVGNANPIAKLFVSEDGTTPNAVLYNPVDPIIMSNNAANTVERLITASTGGTNSGFITFLSSRGTLASPLASQSGDVLGNLNAQGYDGSARQSAATIASAVDGSVSSGIVPGRLVLSTANTSGTLTEAMRITSGQWVGIASSTPATNFSVTGNGYFTGGVGVGVVNTAAGTLAVTGAIAASSTLQVTGPAVFYSTVTRDGAVTNNAAVINNSTVTTGGSGSAVSSIIDGYCTIPQTTVNAFSDTAATCAGATGVSTSDRVFMTATSSFNGTSMIIQDAQAQSGSITVEIYNASTTATLPITSFNYYAIH